MKAKKEQLTIKWVRYWIVSFLIVNIACHLSAGTNADSRFASMLAMAEHHTFQIDRYVTLTVDWAQTPDGHYYSNKAPGPALLGAPLIMVFGKLLRGFIGTQDGRESSLIKHKASWLKLCSYFFQLIPFMMIAYFISIKFIEVGVPLPRVCLALAALLFGNTASVFMSTYYGHAMTAVFVLAAVLSARFHKYVLLGLSFGFAVLSDYSAVVLAIPILLLIKKDFKSLGKIVLGGTLPLSLWVFYHTKCFGGPFHIANEFQNPVFKDVTTAGNYWGILMPFPNPTTVLQLIIGPSRGMLWVVPWILILISWTLVSFFKGRRTDIPQELKFAVLGLGLLLMVNGCFGGWHGGLTPGPRYLCAIFPVFAMSIPSCLDKMSLVWKRSLFISVCMSLVFTIMVYSTNISAQLVPLWPLYFRQTVLFPSSSTISRLVLLVPLFVVLCSKTLRWPGVYNESF